MSPIFSGRSFQGKSNLKNKISFGTSCDSFCRSYHKLKYVMEKKVKEHAVVANSKLYEAGAVYKLYDEIRAIQC